MQYKVDNLCTFRVDPKDGHHTMIANFTAKIVTETRYIDGLTSTTKLTITGEKKDKDGKTVHLPATTMTAEAFPSMTWIMPAWGTTAIVAPVASAKEDLRTQIQLTSTPDVTTVYKHTGWTIIDKKPAFLHAGGALMEKGNNPAVKVQLPPDLARYDLTGTTKDLKNAVAHSLALSSIAPPATAWTLLAATFAPLVSEIDFGIHVTGRSGTFKSELLSLFQSHYGPAMDARHLPASWSSTANALEAQAFFAKNAVFVIDDFVPAGTPWQQRAYQTTADKLFRSQGNQAGRARLTDTSNLQQTMYPRGIIFSTGEDTPAGHSVRARMMILEMTPGDIDTAKLSKAQASRSQFAAATAGFVQWLCTNAPDPDTLRKAIESVRDKHTTIGHSRTPTMLATLTVAIELVLDFAASVGVLHTTKLLKAATTAIQEAATAQITYLETSDPVDIFLQAVRNVLSAGLGHLRTLQAGIPKGATSLGWTKEQSSNDDFPMFKSHGPCIGWISWQKQEIYLDMNSGFTLAKKNAGPDMTLTQLTLLKRLKDAGKLTRTDAGRQRNTIRITADNNVRTVIALPIPSIFEDGEIPADATLSGPPPAEDKED